MSVEILSVAALAVFFGGFAAVVLILLRTPLALLNLRTRMAEIENALALMDSTVKKAARRAGILERATKREAADPHETPTLPGFDPEGLPDASAGAPPRFGTGRRPPGGNGTEEEQLAEVKRYFAYRDGGS